MPPIAWTKKDWELRELLRSAGSIEELFRVYRQNREYIAENRPELAKFTLRVFWNKLYNVRSFGRLVLAKDATDGLPANDMVWREIRLTMLDQITVGLA